MNAVDDREPFTARKAIRDLRIHSRAVSGTTTRLFLLRVERRLLELAFQACEPVI